MRPWRDSLPKLLAPLLAQKPHYKPTLAETLMCWLQARESAPILAERLNVHSNTVLTRLRHLRDLFGNQLLRSTANPRTAQRPRSGGADLARTAPVRKHTQVTDVNRRKITCACWQVVREATLP
ncbi:helix-turn-helix domain-containing protein [Aeromicrobium sp. UC242_57]|uniref:helix-turn-helix domain-containing protein n=1 Tax=Aeromicrobium sp. UC242_57 TaxID=3374624 RepID=UPI00378BBDE0